MDSDERLLVVNRVGKKTINYPLKKQVSESR